MRSNLRSDGVDHRRSGTEGYVEKGNGLVRRLAGNAAKQAKRPERTTIPIRAGAFAAGRTAQPLRTAMMAAAKERAELNRTYFEWATKLSDLHAQFLKRQRDEEGLERDRLERAPQRAILHERRDERRAFADEHPSVWSGAGVNQLPYF